MSIKVNVNSAPGSARVSTGTSPVSIKVVQQGPQGATGATGPQGPAGASSATGTYSLPGVWYDIRDFAIGDEQTTLDWSPALQATIDFIGAGGHFKTILIPSMTYAELGEGSAGYVSFTNVTIPDPDVDDHGKGTPGWTFLFANNRIWFDNTWSLPNLTTVKGLYEGNSNATTGQFPNGNYINGPADPKFYLGPTSNNCWIENLAIDAGGIAIHMFQQGTSTIKNIKASGGDTSDKPALKIDGCFWVNVRDCILQNGAFPTVHITNSENFEVGGGLIDFNNLQLNAFGVLIDPQFGTQSGGINITDCLMEGGQTTDAMIVTDSSAGVPIHDCNFTRIASADSVGDFYLYKNVGLSTGGIRFLECSNVSMHPDSEPVQGLEIDVGAIGTGGVNVGAIFAAPATNQAYGHEWPESVDKQLITAPRGPQIVIGQALSISQDYSDWNSGATGGGTVTACRGPDGSMLGGSYAGLAGDFSNLYDVFYTPANALNAWFIAASWVQNPNADETTTFDELFCSKVPLLFDDTLGGAAGYEVAVNYFNAGVGHSAVADQGWHWFIAAMKITAVGAGNARVRFHLSADDVTYNFFNPCLMYIPGSDGWTDKAVIDAVRAYRGGWSPTAVQGEMGILDHQTFYSGTALSLIDGVTAPSTVTGRAQIYVDTADGDLKVKFGDGTVKTIVVDT